MTYLDGVKGRCDIPSNLTEDDFSADKYTPGSVVWAKLGVYPWWPGIVEDNPDIEEYTWTQKGEELYHVTYFGDEVSRSWVKEEKIMPFVKRPKLTINKKYKRQLKIAIEQAERAEAMDIQERLKFFSFAVRYKGKCPKADDFGTGVPDPAKFIDVPQKKRKKVKQQNDDTDQCLKPNEPVFNPSMESSASQSPAGSLDTFKGDEEQKLDSLLKTASILPKVPQPVSYLTLSYGNQEWKCIVNVMENGVDKNNPKFLSYKYYTTRL